LELIFCAGDNQRFLQIAQTEGWLLGVQSHRQSYDYSIHFVDLDYMNPHLQFETHLRRVAAEQPKLAIVPDMNDKLFSLADVERALLQAERLQSFCKIPLVVPKFLPQLALIPQEIAVGYSVDTTHGSACFHWSALAGRRQVHLLGGNPHLQMRIRFDLETRYNCRVISADCNMIQREAIRHAKYWQASKWKRLPYRTPKDQYYDYFRLSCRNVAASWQVFEQELSNLALAFNSLEEAGIENYEFA